MRSATNAYRVALSLCHNSASSKPPFRIPTITKNPLRLPSAASMATRSNGGGEQGSNDRVRDPSSNPKVVRLRNIVHRDSAGQCLATVRKDATTLPKKLITTHSLRLHGWEESWEEGVTPWDLKQVTPVVQHLVESGLLPKGRGLVPGCGTGYDVVAMASADRHVTGLDIANSAIKKAKEWSASSPNENWFTFMAADFFTWQPVEKFDLIFDYTFFCAIDPHLRPAWAKKISEILKPDGELITLIYLISDQEGGPPYNNTVSDYEEVLNPLSFKASSIEENELAVAPRKGREKLARWKRIVNKSSL